MVNMKLLPVIQRKVGSEREREARRKRNVHQHERLIILSHLWITPFCLTLLRIFLVDQVVSLISSITRITVFTLTCILPLVFFPEDTLHSNASFIRLPCKHCDISSPAASIPCLLCVMHWVKESGKERRRAGDLFVSVRGISCWMTRSDSPFMSTLDWFFLSFFSSS